MPYVHKNRKNENRKERLIKKGKIEKSNRGDIEKDWGKKCLFLLITQLDT